MKKYKICIYAISKNEEKFVDRWFDSMKEADEIFVLDTGSTDNTVNLLKEKGVNVITKDISPWRFDVARNESLNMVPNDYDICVCTDLDEVFNKGWRIELEKKWKKHTTRLKYIYNWSLDEDDKPKISFYYEKIHSRKGYKWIYPVHEILKYNETIETIEITDKIVLNHYPDNTKSRSSYLPLLELSVKENPDDDRNLHYLGREYMYYQKYNESIDTLIKHLNLKTATWRDERCASMRFISRCYQKLNRYDEARMWLDKAINEAPYLRDAYMERALLEYELHNYDDMISYCLNALKITNHQKTYINETFSWDETVYDLLSIGFYYKNNLNKALEYINMALKINPKNSRIIENKIIIENQIKKDSY